MYAKKVMDHFKNPEHAGSIEKPDAYGKVGNITCGDIMELFIRIKDNRIHDIKFMTFGCAAAIASTDVLCGLVKGKTIEEARKIGKQDIVAELGELPPVKLHCSVLATEALHKALDEHLNGKHSDVHYKKRDLPVKSAK